MATKNEPPDTAAQRADAEAGAVQEAEAAASAGASTWSIPPGFDASEVVVADAIVGEVTLKFNKAGNITTADPAELRALTQLGATRKE